MERRSADFSPMDATTTRILYLCVVLLAASLTCCAMAL